MFATEIYLDRRNRLVRQFNKALILSLGNGESPINSFENCYPFRQEAASFISAVWIGPTTTFMTLQSLVF